MKTPDELLMEELASVMDSASKNIDTERREEAIRIISMVSDAWDSEGLLGSYLFAMSIVDPEEAVAMGKDDETKVVDTRPYHDDKDLSDYHGGKISKLYTFDTHDQLCAIIASHESMVMTCALEDPVGLFIRTNPSPTRRLSAFASPQNVVVRITVNGEHTHHIWEVPEQYEQVETVLADLTEDERSLARLLWEGLYFPKRMRKEYPDMFEGIVRDLKRKAGMGDESDTD